MSWKYLKRAVKYGYCTLSGFSLFNLINNEKFKVVQNFWTTDYEPSTKWDSNWDNRASTCLISTSSEEANLEKQNSKKKFENRLPKAIRHIILIRHGQYILNGMTDKEKNLSELGRFQAKITGDRLKELKIPITEFVMSTMTRAEETGKIILNQLENTHYFNVQYDSLIEEGVPVAPEPEFDQWKPESRKFYVDEARIEAGFRKHFYRADSKQENDSYTVLVCHANVIRYYVCRALQVPPEAYLRTSLYHASITWLSIHPNGRVMLRLFGDSGHIPPMYLTIFNQF